MKVKLFDLLVWSLVVIATGIPLVAGFALDTWRTILTVLTVIVAASYILTHKIKKSEKNKFLSCYIFAMATVVMYEAIIGKNSFNYTLYEIFYALRQYIWIISAIPLYYVMLRSKSFDKTMKTISNIVLASLALRTITWFFKNYLGITIFYNLLYEYGNTWSRSGRQRIDATALIGVIIPVLFYLYEKENKKKYIYRLGAVILYLLFVCQTRTLVLGCFVCILSMIFFKKRPAQKKLILQLSFMSILAIAFGMGAFDALLSKMNILTDKGTIAYGYRAYEWMYYSSLLSDENWKTGIGIISAINPNGARLLYGNLDTVMYLDDMGIFECFLQFGVLSIVLYGGIIVYIIYVIHQCNESKEYKYSFYLVGQLIYIIVVSIPLNLFGVQRSFSVAVILAIVCTISNLTRRNHAERCKLKK